MRARVGEEPWRRSLPARAPSRPRSTISGRWSRCPISTPGIMSGTISRSSRTGWRSPTRGRPIPPPSLDREGFQLVPHRSAVTDFEDAEQTATIYAAEVEALIRELTGADLVIARGTVLALFEAAKSRRLRQFAARRLRPCRRVARELRRLRRAQPRRPSRPRCPARRPLCRPQHLARADPAAAGPAARRLRRQFGDRGRTA